MQVGVLLGPIVKGVRSGRPFPAEDRACRAEPSVHMAISDQQPSAPEATAPLGSTRESASTELPRRCKTARVDARERYLSPKRVVQIAALALALTAALMIAVLPMYTEMTVSSDGTESTSRATVLEVNGLWVLVLIAVPVLLAALPLSARGRAWQPLSITSAALLSACVVLGMVSIGLFFLPAAVVAIVGACLSPRSTRPRVLPDGQQS